MWWLIASEGVIPEGKEEAVVFLLSSLWNHDLSLLEYPAPCGRDHAGEQQQVSTPGDLLDHRTQCVSHSPSRVFERRL